MGDTVEEKDPYCVLYGKKATLGHLIVGECPAHGHAHGHAHSSPQEQQLTGGRPRLDRSLSVDVPRSASSTSLASMTSTVRGVGDPELGQFVNKQKPGKQLLRWNLLFNVILWVLLPLPIWLPFLDKYLGTSAALIAIPGVQAVFALFFTAVTAMAVRTAVVLYLNRNVDFVEKMREKKLKFDDVQHLVALCVYKEPLEVIASSVETLAKQSPIIRKNTTLVIGFEERSPDLKAKQGAICDRFRRDFREIVFSVHPYGVEGEIPGKCSNSNCAIRTGVAHLNKCSSDGRVDMDNVLITNGDSDNRFHPRYLEALTHEFLAAGRDRGSCIFQAPLLYNWNLDESFFVTRVTGLLRAFLMMGALIPFNINTMSVFSFSASLCVAGDYIHPGYQMDDIIALIRWMGVCRKRLRVAAVPVAIVSGPTSGRIPEDDFKEWARQARRWTIGAGEVFHYFMAKARGIPVGTSISWGLLFIFYYGIILCCSSLYGVVSGLSAALLVNRADVVGADTYDLTHLSYFNYAMAALLVHQYCVFAAVFVLDRVTVRLAVPRVEEGIGPIRNAFHFLLAPFVLLLYSAVEFYSLHELAVRGKDVCSHKPSRKDQLGK